MIPGGAVGTGWPSHMPHRSTQARNIDRWILPFNLPRSAANHSNMRRWTAGRIAVDHEDRMKNVWMLQSERSLAGRPLKACACKHLAVEVWSAGSRGTLVASFVSIRGPVCVWPQFGSEARNTGGIGAGFQQSKPQTQVSASPKDVAELPLQRDILLVGSVSASEECRLLHARGV